MKRLLMVAFHFPPMAGGSGIQRTLRFVQHLPALGWQPLVLSADPRAYVQTATDLLPDVPPGTVVQRAFTLDTARHLSVRGRYFGWMARPDRWMSWQWSAVRDGMRLIEQFKPDAIWSTYPLATAHLIGAKLQRKSGLPWVADFRDPMAQEDYPADSATWQSFKRIEELAIRQAAACIFTTPSAARAYKTNYPHAAARMHVLENGFDEETFASLTAQVCSAGPLNPGKVTLLHSGIVYPSERDPSHFLAALALCLQQDRLPRQSVRVRFRAAIHEDMLGTLIQKYGLQDVVEMVPNLPYRAALVEMMCADALLVMQAAKCNAQIPAKLYEYLRAGRPILGLTDPSGDTADTLRTAGIKSIAPLNNATQIADLLPDFLARVKNGQAELPLENVVHAASRRTRAQALGSLLDQLTQKQPSN